ncbi:hypothetical protein AB4Y35_22830 [Paraburkholderia sp. EG286A]
MTSMRVTCAREAFARQLHMQINAMRTSRFLLVLDMTRLFFGTGSRD